MADVIIVGSGPAGTSAALPLVESGLQVVMIAGQPREKPETDESFAPPYANLFRLFGSRLESLHTLENLSPKWSLYHCMKDRREFAREYGMQCREFRAFSSVTEFGASTLWAGNVARTDSSDWQGWPVDPASLEESFREVESRLNICSTADGLGAWYGDQEVKRSLGELEPVSRHLLENSRKQELSQMIIGQSRWLLSDAGHNNVTRDFYARHDDIIPANPVFSSADDIARLTRHPNFRLMHGLVKDLGNEEGRAWVRGDDAEDNPFSMSAKRIVLAAGTLGSTALALRAINHIDKFVPFHSHPVAGFALLIPKLIGRSAVPHPHMLANLTFILQQNPAMPPRAYGHLFAGSALLARDFIFRIPCSMPASRNIARVLTPAIAVGNVYLPSKLTSHKMKLTEKGELRIEGGTSPAVTKQFQEIKAIIRQETSRLGAYLLPKSFAQSPTGTDIHYAASLPMKKKPEPWQCHPNGQLAGEKCIYVADGASLTTLPLRPPTLTIMANANRIGHAVVGELKSS